MKIITRIRYLSSPLLFCMLLQTGHGQNISLIPEPGFFEYVTYYISGFDIQTGSSNFQFFRYRLHADQYPADAKIEFIVKVKSPALGINSATTILRLETSRFRMPSADILLDNRNISKNTTFLYDQANPPNAIPVQVTTYVDVAKFDALISSVVTSGRIIDGEYTFIVRAYAGMSSIPFQVDKTIAVQTPTAVNLQAPGGYLSDTARTVTYTPYPLFMWDTDLCSKCVFYLRVAEFDRHRHSSLDEAIEDETMLPVNQSERWKNIGRVTNYQYPLSGARPLESNKIYVWQVRKTFPTTAGLEEYLSEIYTFKIGSMTVAPGSGTALHPIVLALQEALGDDQYNAIFGKNGPIEGFVPTGSYSLNGITIDQTSAAYIISQITSQNVTVTDVQVK